jgi:hypothetical protein
MPDKLAISLLLHGREIHLLVTGFVLLMIDSPVARAVVAACLGLGLIFALAFRVVARKNDPGAMRILHTPPVIQ